MLCCLAGRRKIGQQRIRALSPVGACIRIAQDSINVEEGNDLVINLAHTRYEVEVDRVSELRRWFDLRTSDGKILLDDHSLCPLELRRGERDLQTPLIGRATQMSMLQSRWSQACEDMGQVLLIVGEEGMGNCSCTIGLV